MAHALVGAWEAARNCLSLNRPTANRLGVVTVCAQSFSACSQGPAAYTNCTETPPSAPKSACSVSPGLAHTGRVNEPESIRCPGSSTVPNAPTLLRCKQKQAGATPKSMEEIMRPSFYNRIVLAAALSIPLVIPEHAFAQNYSPDMMEHCAQIVGQMTFEGWPADRNKEMMMSSCEMNGGQIPGAPSRESPASLHHTHHHAAAHSRHG